MINATKEIFSKSRPIGYYYHYCRNIREKTYEFKSNNKNHKNDLKLLLNELYKLPFLYHKNRDYFQTIKTKYEIIDNSLKEYLNYFENQWYPYFTKGNLDYHYLSKELRSNSYIENYNRRIKLKLCKFLFGKNHCLITWPLFLYFMKEEESDYRMETYNNEKGLIVHNKKVKKLKKIKKKKILDSDENKSDIDNKFEKNNSTKEKINTYKIWFKLNYNSCRYDSFSLIYGLIIKPTMEKENITPQNGVINYINELVNIFLNLTENIYEEGIWNIL